jgi:hypothetical protein
MRAQQWRVFRSACPARGPRRPRPYSPNGAGHDSPGRRPERSGGRSGGRSPGYAAAPTVAPSPSGRGGQGVRAACAPPCGYWFRISRTYHWRSHRGRNEERSNEGCSARRAPAGGVRSRADGGLGPSGQAEAPSGGAAHSVSSGEPAGATVAISSTGSAAPLRRAAAALPSAASTRAPPAAMSARPLPR